MWQNSLIALISFICVIFVLVFVHEIGHYLFARKNKAKVEEFSIGFGKEIWGFTDKQGTRWKICIFPLGGYVKFLGDVDPASTTNIKDLEKLPLELKNKTLYYKSPWQRIQIFFGGPLFNYLLAFVIYVGLFAANGQKSLSPVIADVIPQSSAQVAGLKKGDLILSIDKMPIKSFEDILVKLDEKKTYIKQRYAKFFKQEREILLVPKLNTPQLNKTAQRLIYDAQMHWKVQRMNGKKESIIITPRIVYKTGRFWGNKLNLDMGIQASSKIVKLTALSFGEAIKEALFECYKITKGIFISLLEMINDLRSTAELGSIIKIADLSGQAASMGLNSILSFLATLSINLGAFNLLPVPILDGGHLAFNFAELISRKRISPKAQAIAVSIGFFLVISIMALGLAMDLKGLWYKIFMKG